jgi:AcrR family transcriptional regulator
LPKRRLGDSRPGSLSNDGVEQGGYESPARRKPMAVDTLVGGATDLETPEGNAKRRQIMEGARAVFLAAGFDGASMNDVARAAGVSKGTLYVYFDSKEQLFEALIREERRQQAERITLFMPGEGDIREVLHNFGCRLLEMMARPEHLAHVRTVIAAAAKFPQLGKAFFEAGPCFGANCLAAYLRQQTDAGILKVADCDRAAWQFLELIQAGIFKSLLFRMVDALSPAEISAAVGAGVDVFLAAYGVPGAVSNPEQISAPGLKTARS